MQGESNSPSQFPNVPVLAELTCRDVVAVCGELAERGQHIVHLDLCEYTPDLLCDQKHVSEFAWRG